MAQRIACPDCGKHLQIAEDLLGSTVQCPECKHTFIAALPTASDAEPVAAPAPPPEKPIRDDHDDYPKASPGSPGRVPSKVTAVGAMALIGGITGVLLSLGLAGGSFGFCCMWPGTYYSLVMGILAIIRGSALLGPKASQQRLPTGIAIMSTVIIAPSRGTM